MKERMENAKLCNASDADAMDQMAGNAEYTCSRCGLKSHSENSLCAPVHDVEA